MQLCTLKFYCCISEYTAKLAVPVFKKYHFPLGGAISPFKKSPRESKAKRKQGARLTQTSQEPQVFLINMLFVYCLSLWNHEMSIRSQRFVLLLLWGKCRNRHHSTNRVQDTSTSQEKKWRDKKGLREAASFFRSNR